MPGSRSNVGLDNRDVVSAFWGDPVLDDEVSSRSAAGLLQEREQDADQTLRVDPVEPIAKGFIFPRYVDF